MRKRGFTLIELLVVIAIIMILYGAVHPMLTVSSARTRELSCESNLQHVGMAMSVYVEDYGKFPARLTDLDGIIQDKDSLSCPKTSRQYYYRAPAKTSGPDTVVVTCIDPKKKPGRWPHMSGDCYLELTASGDVRRHRR